MEDSLPIIYNFTFENSDNILTLGDFQNYSDVSIFVEWSGLVGLDSVITFVVKGSINSLHWIEVPILKKTLDITDGQVQMRHAIFSGRLVGLKIAKNNCYGGVLNIYVNAK